MKLNNGPFKNIKNGTKTIELRLNDEKRQLLKIKDLIEFTNRETLEQLLVEIENLYHYPSFEELYKHFDKVAMGYKEDEEEIHTPSVTHCPFTQSSRDVNRIEQCKRL